MTILHILLLVVIFCFISYSYFVGARSIFKGRYRPSIYSRTIWFFLTLNSFVSIVALKNSSTVIAYGVFGLIGNLAILLLSIKKSSRSFGRTELISTALLLISLVIWLVTKLPLLNLSIGLIAHFIGGIPTIRKAIAQPKDENVRFWLYFCIASILTTPSVSHTKVSDYLYPLYFALFDGFMVILCIRRYSSNTKKLPKNDSKIGMSAN